MNIKSSNKDDQLLKIEEEFVKYGACGLTFGTVAVRNSIIHYFGLAEYLINIDKWNGRYR